MNSEYNLFDPLEKSKIENTAPTHAQDHEHRSEQDAGSKIAIGRIMSFATITAAGFMLGKFSGILREVVVSAQFGLSAGLDAYFVAGTVPTIINNIVAGSTIVAAVIPTFARYLARGEREEFWRVASIITTVVMLITGTLTVLSMVFAAPIIAIVGVQFPPATQALAAQLLVIMMPTLALGALLNMLMAMLNSLDRFTAPALIFLALNTGIIATVIILSPVIGIYAVAWGFLIGVALQVALQFVELRHEHPQFHWQIDWHHPALRQVLRAFVPITAISIIAQINILVDKTMATGLPEGSIGALYYADSVLGMFYMIGISLGNAVFPSLSRMATTNDLESTGRTITTSLRMLIFILMPLTFLLVPFAAPTIGFILGRGKFDLTAVDMTASALAMYAIGLIAIAAMYVLQRAFYALGDNSTPFVVGAGAMLLHIALNLVLMQPLAHAGIALSASISTVMGVLGLTILLMRRVPHIALGHLAVYLIQSALLALASTALVAWLFAQMQLSPETLTARITGVTFVGIGGLIYLIAARVFRIRESDLLLETGLNFLRRKSHSHLL